MSSLDFEQTQERALRRFGIAADSRRVPLAVPAGDAHMLVAGDGPPVVMLNGMGTPAVMWAPLMAHLPGFTLCAVDLPGFGLTDATSKIADDHRAVAVGFLEQVLDGLGLSQARFVSNSLGSLWTLWLALDRPERVHSMVHIGCPALVLDTTVPMPMRLLSVPRLARVINRLDPPSAKQVERLAKLVGQHPLEPEIADVLLATEQLPRCQEAFQMTLSSLVRFRGPRPEMRLRAEELAKITHPTQLIWGSQDPFGTSVDGEQVAAAISGSEFHLVDGGHSPWLGSASEIGGLVQKFLGRTQAVAQGDRS